MYGNTKVYRSFDKANEIADKLNETDEDGWRYVVIDCLNGLAYIKVYDEDLVFVGYL